MFDDNRQTDTQTDRQTDKQMDSRKDKTKYHLLYKDRGITSLTFCKQSYPCRPRGVAPHFGKDPVASNVP